MTSTKKQAQQGIRPKENYLRYQNYKESFIEWIEEIPGNWKEEKLKQTVKGVINGKWGSKPENDEETTTCIRVADFDFEHIKINEGDLTERVIAEDKKQNRLLKKGDLLLEKSGGGDKQPVGRVVLYDLDLDEAVTSNFIGKMTVREDYDSRYLAYLHKTLYEYGVNIRSIKQTTGIQNIDSKQYLDEIVPIPPKKSQKKIVEFLDRETSKIDRLIEKKEKLIDLLEEKRTALISHTITQGLDDDVKTRDSGIEWIGEIPKHWRTQKIKFIKDDSRFALVDGPFGSDLKREHFTAEGNVIVITSELATTGNLNLDDCDRITEDYFEKVSRSEVNAGDIVIAKIGARFGRSSIMPKINSKAVISGNTIKLTLNKQLNSVRFIDYQLSHIKRSGSIDLLSKETAQPALSLSDIDNLILAIPPKAEQTRIANFLDKKVKQLDESIQKVKKAIKSLKEYRTTLISAAVTGKIDVRGEVE